MIINKPVPICNENNKSINRGNDFIIGARSRNCRQFQALIKCSYN